MIEAADTGAKPVHGAASAESPAPLPSAKRRRLLAGAAAVLPSVYTLASGAQTAVASQVACWANEQQQPPGRFITGSDTWFRAKVYLGTYDGYPAYCVSTPQRACVDPFHPGEAADGSVWIVGRTRFMPGFRVGGGLQEYGLRVTAGPGVPITQVTRAPDTYGLVYVDQQGTIATLDPNGSPDLRPVAASCWTSMLGGRIFSLG